MTVVPTGWLSASVNDTGDYVNGMAFKPSDWGDRGLPIIRIQNLTDPSKEFNRTTREIDEPRFIVSNGDILVSWSATLDAFVWDRGRAVLNQHIFKVIPEKRLVLPGFLYHGLRAAIQEMVNSEHLHGSTMKHINRGPFLAHPFLIPPLAEQQRIVAKIESLSAKSCRARDHLGHIPRLVEKYKQAILAATFESTDDQEWSRTTIGDVVVDGLVGLVRSKHQQDGSKGSPYIRMNHYDLDGVWNDRALTFVDVAAGEIGRYELRSGDLLFNTRNSYELVGKVGLWPEGKAGYVYNNNILRLRFTSSVVPAFAFYWMRSPQFRAHLQTLKSATTSVCAIYQRSLMDAPFGFPHRDSQKLIVRRIDSAFAWIGRLAAEAASARKLIDNLDQAIRAKAFRGELVPQDPNDEPASALLERIRTARVDKKQKGTANRRKRPQK